MQIDKIFEQLNKFKDEGRRMFVTSSFQSYSVVLLHIISRFDKSIPVFFINTGYHFPETIVHKNKIAVLLGLDVTDLVPAVAKSLQRDDQGNLLFTFDPDYCCYLNKVEPMEKLLETYDVWINGVRSDQSHSRSNLSIIHDTPSRAVRFHPILDWSEKDLKNYLKTNNLPMHPLESRGYKSIGCEPCTRPLAAEERVGRWFGMKKTECGLNTELIGGARKID